MRSVDTISKLFVYMVCLTHVVRLENAINTTKTIVRHGYRLQESKVNFKTVSRSRVTCIGTCLQWPDCWSVSWNEAENRCLYSTFMTVDHYWNGHGEPENTYASVGWATISKIIYPVFHALPSTGRYTMQTLAEANALCESLDAKVATVGELLEARGLGYDKCGCGMLADGTKGLVIQQPNWNCIGTFHDGVISCHWFVNVNTFCKIRVWRK